jgi:YD repeat-containing protein
VPLCHPYDRAGPLALRIHTPDSHSGHGDPVVANIVGTVSDTIGEVHSYNGGHYLTITGYTQDGRLISITDPADRVGGNEYQVPLDRMADWMATRGYSASS